MERSCDGRSLEAADAVLSTDYGRWHEDLRRMAPAPLGERAISLDELQAFMTGRTGSRLSWAVPDFGQPIFPKIGVASWKCFPWLLPAIAGVDLARSCSGRMRTVLSFWLEAEVEPFLRFFPVIDYRGVVEVRFHLSRGAVSLDRSVGRTGAEMSGTTIRRALGMLEDVRLHIDDVRVDIAVPQHSERPPWLIEINPLRTRSSIPQAPFPAAERQAGSVLPFADDGAVCPSIGVEVR